jgi:purine-nucleoside phosphorylase
MEYTYEMMREAADYIRSRTDIQPEAGLVLGSGLGMLAEEIEHPVYIPYGDIPHYPVSTAPGHAGRLVIGYLAGRPAAVMQGRFHYYEGYSRQVIGFPVRVMKLLGVQLLIVTNAAGGCNTSFSPGDLMLITDHIKFFDDSPLRGPNLEQFGPRFNDMSKPYSPGPARTAREKAAELKIPLREGVYAHMGGPSFETPAEIRMLQTLGADAVGMSTVPEVIVANHCGMQVLGISCITNMAAGILDQPLTHEEVLETGERVRLKFAALIRGIIGAWKR